MLVVCAVCVCRECRCRQERPYHDDNTASRLLSEVKHHRARLVLRWGTTLESRVLFFCSFALLLFCSFALLLFCSFATLVPPLIPRYGYPRDMYGLFFLSVWSHDAHSKYQYPPPVITNYIRRCTLHIPVVHQQLHITITMFPLLLAFNWKSELPWEGVVVVPEELEPHVLVSEVVEAHRTNNSCALHSSQSSYLSHLFNKVMMMLGYDHYLYTIQQRLWPYLLHFGKCTILNY